MKRMQTGFTLIELVVVIVIIGILAVTAVPKFIDLTSEARTAKADGVAGAIASGSAINYAASLAKGQTNGVAIGSASAKTGIVDTTGGCSTTVAGNLLNDATITFGDGSGGEDYDVSSASGSITNIGDTVTCTLTDNAGSETSTFQLIATK